MNEFTTWANLGTMAGAVAAVLVVIQYIKAPLDKVWKVPTRALVYVLSLGILLAAQAALGGLTVESAGLSALNAVVVALAAMGAYEATFNRGK